MQKTHSRCGECGASEGGVRIQMAVFLTVWVILVVCVGGGWVWYRQIWPARPPQAMERSAKLSARDRDYAEEQYQLGLAHAEGRGVVQDDVLALRCYRNAADRGHARAQYQLGRMLGQGRGVTRDYDKAVAWYRRAAEQNLAEAQYYLCLMHEKGWGVSHDMDQALDWCRKSAAQRYVLAQNHLGLVAEEGWYGVPVDYAESAKWYRMTAENGDAWAQFKLGQFYRDGKGVPADPHEAARWLRLSAAQGNGEAQKALADAGL